MGERFDISCKCVYCKTENDCWYAPTCACDTFTCKKCNKNNFVTSNFKAIKIKDVTLEDVIEGFEMTTSVSRTKNEIKRICRERLHSMHK